MWAVPGGDDYYSAVLSHHLSIELSPAEVHDRGLVEVERVRSELILTMDELGYDASTGFIGALRQATADAGSLPTRSEPERALVLEANLSLIEEAETVFSGMFSVKPETTLDVVRPRPGREGGSGAYYRPPPVDGSRGGVYYLSLGGDHLDLFTMATTTYHEAVPGRHFQLSVQRSLNDSPLH